MSELRWMLLIIGLALIVATLVYSLFIQRKDQKQIFDQEIYQDGESGDPLLADQAFSNSDDYSSNEIDFIEPSYEFDSHPTSTDDRYANQGDGQFDSQHDDLHNDELDNDLEELDDIQHVVVLHVIARTENFNPVELKEQLEHIGLRHGKFDFYHRESLQNPDLSLFSVTNMFKPGSFNPEDLSTYQTRGISFFMVLPGPPDGVTTFNEMMHTAKQVASKLDADVYDADRSSFTGQRAQLIRDEIVNFMHQLQTS